MHLSTTYISYVILCSLFLFCCEEKRKSEPKKKKHAIVFCDACGIALIKRTYIPFASQTKSLSAAKDNAAHFTSLRGACDEAIHRSRNKCAMTYFSALHQPHVIAENQRFVRARFLDCFAIARNDKNRHSEGVARRISLNMRSFAIAQDDKNYPCNHLVTIIQ